MKNFKSINEYCNDLKLDYPNLSDYELLSIAVQMQRNDIIKTGLKVPEIKKEPAPVRGLGRR